MSMTVSQTVARRAAGAIMTVYTLGILCFLAVNDMGGESGVEWIFMLPVLTAAVIGLYLTVRRTENVIGTLISVLGAAVATLGAGNILIARSLGWDRPAATVALVQLTDLAWITQFVISLVMLPLWFPTGSAITPRWAWVGRFAVAGSGIAVISFLFAGQVCAVTGEASECRRWVASPWGIDGFAGFEPLLLVAMAMAVPAIGSTLIRWRRSRRDERQQLKWFFFSALGLIGAVVVSFDTFGLDALVLDLVFGTALAGVVVAIAVAVLRYRLYDIDRIVSRTVSYGLVAGLLGLVFFGLITLLTTVLPSDDPLVVAIATLAAAALFNPVRRRVQRFIDRRFNRSRYDSEQVMVAFAESLGDRVDPDDVTNGWIEVVRRTMQPATVTVWVKD